MVLPAAASSAATTVTNAGRGIKRFSRLERVVAAICVAIPLFLIGVDGWSVRDSISAYYNMAEEQTFYVPLMIAAMLFFVNGFIKNGRWYNAALGISLAGVVIFNQDDFDILHKLFAGVFFIGASLVIIFYSTRADKWIRILAGVVILISLLATFAFDWFTLLAAEWIALWIIAIHYILEAWPKRSTARAA